MSAPRLSSLLLRGVRGFENVTIPFGDLTLIIGRNGTSKTTLLRMIAVALADASSAAAMVTRARSRFVRAGEDAATLEVTFDWHGRTVRRTRAIVSDGELEMLWTPEPSPEGLTQPIPIFGYGSHRGLVGGESSRSIDAYTTTSTLFDYREELDDPELTLRRVRDFVDENRYEHLVRSFKRLMDLRDDDDVVIERGGGITLRRCDGRSIDFQDWSDGERINFSLLVDLFGKALRGGALALDGHVEGLVLIDEVDQHLHPALQAVVMDELRSALPRAQIVATTHSPLVALDVDPSSIVVLRSDGGSVSVDPSPRDYRGYTVEDMLMDDRLFDAPVTGSASRQRAGRYDELVARGAGRTDAEDEELLVLAREVREAPPGPEVEADLARTVADIARLLSDD